MIADEGRRTVRAAAARARRQRQDALAVATADHAASKRARFNICVVGGGRMAEIRAAHLVASTSADLAAVVDRSPEAAARCAATFGTDAFLEIDEAVAACEARGTPLDGVWICAPTPAHPRLVEAAARRGLHVAVEKPVAMTVAEIRDAYAACEARGVGLHCAFQRRTDASYAALRAAVANGDAGAVRSVRCTFRDHPTPPLAFLLQGGGDVYHDLATHDVDYVLSLVRASQALAGLGDDAPAHLPHAPTEVYATGASSDPALAAAGIHDSATVLLKWHHSGGCVATLDLSRASSYGYDQRCEVRGDARRDRVRRHSNVPWDGRTPRS